MRTYLKPSVSVYNSLDDIASNDVTISGDFKDLSSFNQDAEDAPW